MIPAITGLGGLLLTIATLILAEYRKSKATAVKEAVLQSATALLTYEKLRLDIVKSIEDRIPKEDVERALGVLEATARDVEASRQTPTVVWPLRKAIALTLVAYSAILIVLGLHSLTTAAGTERIASVAGALIGLILMSYFGNWLIGWGAKLRSTRLWRTMTKQARYQNPDQEI
jgi:hypothetical protein